MRQSLGCKLCFNIAIGIFTWFIMSIASATSSHLSTGQVHATVTHAINEQARKNNNWKLAFITGKHAQVVFMNVSPHTNPKNEIGMETHPFDQVIIIVNGEGKAILAGKTSPVKTGDLIFIPQGVAHNVVNLNTQKPLKLISIYSDTDIPAHAKYQKMSDSKSE